ncbi:MAG: response regulator transcription factor [Mycobacterium leprae]
MPTNKKILVVDDDAKILKAVGDALRQEGATVFTATDGATVLDNYSRYAPDLIVLDVMLPDMDGFEICARLRADGEQVPILFLSARVEESDKIVGFRLGGDDYLTKPFSLNELLLRVKAILRRSVPTDNRVATGNRAQLGQLAIDRLAHRVTLHGEPIELTPREFELLWLMASHPGQVFSRERLLDYAWAHDLEADQSSVTVYIRRLREKIEQNPSYPQYLKTVWGIGYKLEM